MWCNTPTTSPLNKHNLFFKFPQSSTFSIFLLLTHSNPAIIISIGVAGASSGFISLLSCSSYISLIISLGLFNNSVLKYAPATLSSPFKSSISVISILKASSSKYFFMNSFIFSFFSSFAITLSYFIILSINSISFMVS